MQKIFIITCLVLCLAGSVFGQYKRTISFTKDGKKVELKDNFKVYLVLEDSLKTTIIKPVIRNNSFVNPQFKKGQRGTFIFRYKKYLMWFEFQLYSEQNDTFNFGIDYRPFDKKFSEGKRLRGVKYIDYVEFLSYGSYGVGKIKHPKKYRRRILKLIE